MTIADNTQRTESLRSKKISRLLFSYALPAVVGTMVNALYSVVDRIFIGQGVSEYAITGLVISFPIMIFLQAFGMLVGAGASVRVSILLGQKDERGADRILGNAIILTMLLSTSVIILSYIYMEPLLRLFGASDRTLSYAMDYLKIIIPGNIFATLSFSYNSVMRASGYPTKAMIQMVIGAGLNVLLDAIFIFGFDMGIAGAAWATVISMSVTVVYVMIHFFDKRSLVHFRPSAMKPSWSIMASILSVGMAPFAMQLVGSVVTILLNRSFVNYAATPIEGDLAIGVYGILNSYALLIVMTVLGVSQGMQPIVGFNYGAGQIDRVLSTFKLCTGINTAITTVGFLLTMFIPLQLISLFTPSLPMKEIGVSAMRIVFSSFIFVGFQITTSQLFQSIGLAGKAMFLSLSRQVLFLIPLLLIFPRIWSLDGIWYALPASDMLAAIVSCLMIYSQIRILKHKQIQ